MLTATIAFVIGYAAAIYTWPLLRPWLNSHEDEIRRLQMDAAKALDRARALLGKTP